MTNFPSPNFPVDLHEIAIGVVWALTIMAAYIVVGLWMVRRPSEQLATVIGCTLLLAVPVLLYFTVPLIMVLAGYLLTMVAWAVVPVLLVGAVVGYLVGFPQQEQIHP